MPHADRWVEAFLTADPEPAALIEVFAVTTEPLPKKVEAMLRLLEVTLGRRSAAELKEIDIVYDQPENVDLHVLFLITWFRALFFVQPDWSRMHVIRDQIVGWIPEVTRPEIVGWGQVMNGLTRFYAGDTRGYVECIAKVVDGIDPASPHHLRLSIIRAITYLQQGMGAVAELPAASIEIGEISTIRLRNLRVVNAALTGALDEVDLAAIEPIPSTPNARALLWPTEYQVACETLCLIGGAGTSRNGRSLAERVRTVWGGDEPIWLTSARHLLSGHVEQALKCAREYERQPPPERQTIVGFDEYTLIRAELASGHVDAARHLLQVREDRGSWHYIDDLFFARAELLSGNYSQAVSYFERLLQEIDRYKARGRLDFELRLATELRAADVFRLTQGALEKKAAQRSRRRKRTLARMATVDSETTLGSERGRALSGDARGVEPMACVAPQMLEISARIQAFASSPLPVLITGETGVGKEVIARALHESGPHERERFTAINCAALSDALVESEFFGHARGAFTGAQHDHRGILRDSGVGTVLLDEIGDISSRLQTTLLRVLESGEARPVGSSRSYRIRCRILAATHVDLHRAVEEGRFRSDLLFRLLRLHVHVPPLRDRVNDTIALAIHFLNRGRDSGQRAVLSPACKEALLTHSWPGNIRELRNVIERMRVLNSDKLDYSAYDLREALNTRIGRAALPAGWSATAASRVAESATTTVVSPSAVVPDEQALESLLSNNRSPLRRLERVRALFTRLETLQPIEVARLMKVSRHTAARDLRRLCEEGLIAKICPNASPRTHYYRRLGSLKKD